MPTGDSGPVLPLWRIRVEGRLADRLTRIASRLGLESRAVYEFAAALGLRDLEATLGLCEETGKEQGT